MHWCSIIPRLQISLAWIQLPRSHNLLATMWLSQAPSNTWHVNCLLTQKSIHLFTWIYFKFSITINNCSRTFIESKRKENTVFLGPLYSRSQGHKLLGANFEHFWVANWPQVTIKCYHIDIRILINAWTLAQGLQIGLSNLMVSFFFQPWGPYKAIKFRIC
jgi:hypothetical protein